MEHSKILPTPEVYEGANSLKEIPVILDQVKAQRTLVVTTQDIVKLGLYHPLQTLLKESGKEIILFQDVEPDPTLSLVNRIYELAVKSKVQAVIALGGGSVIDSAKIAAVMMTNGPSIDLYIGTNRIEKDPLPIIAIPTTAGTGSEVTPIAIVTDDKINAKQGIISNRIIPKYAILDPLLTLTLPAFPTAITGIDALAHAIEAYTSLQASLYSDTMALKAIELIVENLITACRSGNNIPSRTGMLLGSFMAGIAFANAGVAAVHALAYPLGGKFHLPHGLTISLMLPDVIEFNLENQKEKFNHIKQVFVLRGGNLKQSLAEDIRTLRKDLRIPSSLEEVNIPKTAIPLLAEEAVKITRLLKNNPRPITLQDAIGLYEKAYYTR